MEVCDGKCSTRSRRGIKECEKVGGVTKDRQNLLFLWRVLNEEGEPGLP